MNFLYVGRFARGEIVEPDNGLVKFEQRFSQMGSDKTGYASDKPRVMFFLYLVKAVFIDIHEVLVLSERAPIAVSPFFFSRFASYYALSFLKKQMRILKLRFQRNWLAKPILFIKV